MTYHATAQMDPQTGVFVGAGGPRKRYYLFENFAQLPGLNGDLANATEATREPVNRNFEVLGTNMTSALATFADGGGCTVTTAGADGDQAVIIPHLDTKQSAWAQAKWNSDDEVGYETMMELGATITAGIWLFGLTEDTSIDATDPWVPTEDTDYVYIGYSTAADTNWTLYYGNGTDYAIDLGITPAASTHYGMQISFDKDRFINVYMSDGDSEFKHIHKTKNAMTADTDLTPRFHVEENGGGAARAATCRYLAIGKTYND
tara:strand:- start:1923 stop:2705 length:783 start_codon:yes stop_codon:yes gene_type:complete